MWIFWILDFPSDSYPSSVPVSTILAFLPFSHSPVVPGTLRKISFFSRDPPHCLRHTCLGLTWWPPLFQVQFSFFKLSEESWDKHFFFKNKYSTYSCWAQVIISTQTRGREQMMGRIFHLRMGANDSYLSTKQISINWGGFLNWIYLFVPNNKNFTYYNCSWTETI